jgi:hypothetical protein
VLLLHAAELQLVAVGALVTTGAAVGAFVGAALGFVVTALVGIGVFTAPLTLTHTPHCPERLGLSLIVHHLLLYS